MVFNEINDMFYRLKNYIVEEQDKILTRVMNSNDKGEGVCSDELFEGWTPVETNSEKQIKEMDEFIRKALRACHEDNRILRERIKNLEDSRENMQKINDMLSVSISNLEDATGKMKLNDKVITEMEDVIKRLHNRLCLIDTDGTLDKLGSLIEEKDVIIKVLDSRVDTAESKILYLQEKLDRMDKHLEDQDDKIDEVSKKVVGKYAFCSRRCSDVDSSFIEIGVTLRTLEDKINALPIHNDIETLDKMKKEVRSVAHARITELELRQKEYGKALTSTSIEHNNRISALERKISELEKNNEFLETKLGSHLIASVDLGIDDLKSSVSANVGEIKALGLKVSRDLSNRINNLEYFEEKCAEALKVFYEEGKKFGFIKKVK